MEINGREKQEEEGIGREEQEEQGIGREEQEEEGIGWGGNKRRRVWGGQEEQGVDRTDKRRSVNREGVAREEKCIHSLIMSSELHDQLRDTAIS